MAYTGHKQYISDFHLENYKLNIKFDRMLQFLQGLLWNNI